MKEFITLVTVIFCFSISYSQEEKKIIIPVYGEGVTKDLAIQNALNSAIEETYNMFVGDMYTTYNLTGPDYIFKDLDNTLKNEMVSISNGNIQNFEVLSEFKIPRMEFSFDLLNKLELDDIELDEYELDQEEDFQLIPDENHEPIQENDFKKDSYSNILFSNNVKYAVILSVTISLSRLTSFCKLKGLEIKYKGNAFVFNFDYKNLKEIVEQKTVGEVCGILKKIADKSFNFSIKSSDPVLEDPASDLFAIPYEITISTNNNFLTFKNYLFNALKAVSMSENEIDNYNKLGKKVYAFSIAKDKENLYSEFFRTDGSRRSFDNVLNYFKNSMASFRVINEYYSYVHIDGKLKDEINLTENKNEYFFDYEFSYVNDFSHDKQYGVWTISFIEIEEGTELVNISFKEKVGLNELREISEYKILPVKR